ncbi:uncharacterized protein LOC134911556 [Pseudophryne corroboree]|uniref:uncharacterized protein LOC134911556 n=1 Tax=Pseudophryne corroboree TaxID=495146 RepID=UPI00308182D3
MSAPLPAAITQDIQVDATKSVKAIIKPPNGGSGEVVSTGTYNALYHAQTNVPHIVRPKQGDVIEFSPVRVITVPNGKTDDQGTIPVQDSAMRCPWSRTELRSIMSEFPDPRKNLVACQRFIKELGNSTEPTNKDWRTVLRACLPSSVDPAKFITDCQLDTEVPQTEEHNQECIKQINQQLEVYFPAVVKWNEIFSIRQNERESISNYFNRALQVMARNTGITDIKTCAQHREIAVKVLMNGLKEVLRTRVQTTNPNWRNISVAALREAAIDIDRNTTRYRESQSDKLMAASIQALTTRPLQHKPQTPARNSNVEVCYNCQKEGHFARDCRSGSRQKSHQPPRQRHNHNIQETREAQGKRLMAMSIRAFEEASNQPRPQVIDTWRKPRVCYHCRREGHYASDCNNPHKVRPPRPRNEQN